MNAPDHSLAVWKSGRLVPRAPLSADDVDAPSDPAPASSPSSSSSPWIIAALLLACAGVMAIYVAVLQQDVGRATVARQDQVVRAVAEARCEVSQPGPSLEACTALFSGRPVTIAALPSPTPVNDVDEDDGPVMTGAVVALPAAATVLR